MKPVRLVLDANVYFAAAQYLARYYTSPEILQELQNKLESLKLGFSRANVVHWMNRLEEAVAVVRPQQKVDVLTELDPDDNKILECALEVKADLIITTDQDLLSLQEFGDTKTMHTSSVKYLFPQLKDK